MDYTHQPLLFKARKAVRYVRLYGLSRTAIKIRSSYHMRRSGLDLDAPARPGRDDAHVGIIGCGNFAYSTLAYFLRRRHGFVIRGVMDLDPQRAASLARDYRAHYHTVDADRVLEDDDIDLVFVASFHSSHADYAIRALERGKHVHIEKPHAVTRDQLERLCEAMERSSGRVNLGFNRPHSPMSRALQERLSHYDGPIVASWFVLGHELPPDHWYHRPEEGGRIPGNFCHWSDHAYQLMPEKGRYPLLIRPTSGASTDADLSVSYRFGDGSIANVTFAESKGHTFEGVRENLTVVRGDLYGAIQDFARGHIDEGASRIRLRGFFRDPGHEATVMRSYEMARPGRGGVSPAYVWETGEITLATRQAIEEDREIVLQPYRPADRPGDPPADRADCLVRASRAEGGA